MTTTRIQLGQSANVKSDGTVVQLDARPEPDENVTDKAVEDPKVLARFILRLFREVSTLRRRWKPRRLDFEDVLVDATGLVLYRFAHNFGGRVRWYPVGFREGASGPSLVEDSSTTDNVLVLSSYSDGYLTLRVEEAG